MTRRESFWDRRRAAVQAEAEAAPTRDAPPPADPRSDAEILEALNLPDPATLKMGDDFTGFLARAVPLHLKNRALRQLWRSNPVLACVDGLNDYDDDYLTGSTGNGPLKTAYQVGKGMLSHLEARTAHDVRPDTETPEAETPDTETPDTETSGALAFDAAPADAGDIPPEVASDDIEGDNVAPPTPRRMRFTFEGQTT